MRGKLSSTLFLSIPVAIMLYGASGAILKALSTEPVWTANTRDALAKSVEESKPILVLVQSSNCPACLKMKNVLNRPDVLEVLKKRYTLVSTNTEVDGNTYGVSAVPTLILADASGQELGRLVGYHDKTELFRWLNSTESVLSRLVRIEARLDKMEKQIEGIAIYQAEVFGQVDDRAELLKDTLVGIKANLVLLQKRISALKAAKK